VRKTPWPKKEGYVASSRRKKNNGEGRDTAVMAGLWVPERKVRWKHLGTYLTV